MWTATGVLNINMVTWVFGSTCRIAYSGDLSPRTGIVFSHFNSDGLIREGKASVTGSANAPCPHARAANRAASESAARSLVPRVLLDRGASEPSAPATVFVR